jgi:IclR family acetate operon transcriptional repressor
MFLAHLPPHELDALLSRPLVPYTDRTITSPTELRRQLEVIRQQGYGFDDEEYEIGIRAVSAPIRNHEGTVVAVIGMPGPTSRMTLDRIPEIAEAIREAADALSRRMGWHT